MTVVKNNKSLAVNYDDNNVFQKILQHKISCRKVYEDDHVLAFYDINPQAKIHILIIPKLSCTDFTQFMERANQNAVQRFMQAAFKLVKKFNLHNYRLIINNGKAAGQVIYHMHLHLLSDEDHAQSKTVDD